MIAEHNKIYRFTNLVHKTFTETPFTNEFSPDKVVWLLIVYTGRLISSNKCFSIETKRYKITDRF